MQTKKLTGWLILLIIWIGVFGFSGGVRSLGEMAKVYKPYIVDYPSLRPAIAVSQLLLGVGICAWVYTAWLLFHREPGTLGRAQMGLLVGSFSRVVSAFSIPLCGGLPPNVSQPLLQQAMVVAAFVFLFTGVWHQYLARSQRVREIYADI